MKVLLIMIMSSQWGIAYQGFGGVSLEQFDSMEDCREAKHLIMQDLRKHNLDEDDITITCNKVGN